MAKVVRSTSSSSDHSDDLGVEVNFFDPQNDQSIIADLLHVHYVGMLGLNLIIAPNNDDPSVRSAPHFGDEYRRLGALGLDMAPPDGEDFPPVSDVRPAPPQSQLATQGRSSQRPLVGGFLPDETTGFHDTIAASATERRMTPKQDAFCREFQIDGNSTQAAVRAGYSPRTAYSAGHRLLKNVEVAARIGELRDGRFARLALTAERLDCEIAKVAYFNPAKLLRVNKDGAYDLDLSKASEEDMAALVIESGPQGLRIKSHDKVGAIGLGYRRLRLLTDRVEVAASEDFAALLAAADKRVNRDA